MYSVESEEFDEEVLSMEAEMMQCNTVEEMMYCIPQCIPSLKCDAMYLVLDDHLNAYKKETEKSIPTRGTRDWIWTDRKWMASSRPSIIRSRDRTFCSCRYISESVPLAM